LERRARSGLEADARVAAGARELEQVLQQALGGPATQVTRGGPHRLDLGARAVELLQRAARQEVVAVPDGEERDRRLAQPGEIERVDAARRRARVHAGEVLAQQIEDARVVEVAVAD